MDDTTTKTGTAAAQWNGPSGEAWVDLQRALDAMLEPFTPLLLDAAITSDTRRLLDVGCGAGATTLAAARRLGAGGTAVGVDVSAPLIEAARRRTADAAPGTARFTLGDAATVAFEPGAYDALVSRFGVMFFEDPVAAFANLRGAMRDGASLAFVAWRSPAENPFMTAAARAAAPLLPGALPKPDPEAPGQWAFADRERVARILARSGWRDVAIAPVDVPASVPLADLDDYVLRLGPVGVALRDADDATRDRVAAAVRPAFVPFLREGAARFDCACWLVTARPG